MPNNLKGDVICLLVLNGSYVEHLPFINFF